MLPLMLVYMIDQKQPLLTGQLVAPRISGLYYETSSGLHGYTFEGKFSYQNKDTITFYWGNQHDDYPLGSASAQGVLTLANLAMSPQKYNNLLRTLVALDTHPEDTRGILLQPEALALGDVHQALSQADWHNPHFSIPPLALPSLEQASAYMREGYNRFVFRPLNLILRKTFIKLRKSDGELCFYDLAKGVNKAYKGPIGRITYKVTDELIYSYPDKGDHFGSRDGSVDQCELNLVYQLKKQEVAPISDVAGFKGVIGCAHKGCTYSDLSGFSIEDYVDGNERKYRSVAFSFDAKTQLVTEKKQGLGKTEGIRTANLEEFIMFTTVASAEKTIDFDGIWQETHYVKKRKPSFRCLLINKGQVYQAPILEDECKRDPTLYTEVVSANYADMWWLRPKSSAATLAQLNTPVKWYDKADTEQYTRWEYVPVGDDWLSGTLFRLQLAIIIDKNGKKKRAETFSVREYKRLFNTNDKDND